MPGNETKLGARCNKQGGSSPTVARFGAYDNARSVRIATFARLRTIGRSKLRRTKSSLLSGLTNGGRNTWTTAFCSFCPGTPKCGGCSGGWPSRVRAPVSGALLIAPPSQASASLAGEIRRQQLPSPRAGLEPPTRCFLQVCRGVVLSSFFLCLLCRYSSVFGWFCSQVVLRRPDAC